MKKDIHIIFKILFTIYSLQVLSSYASDAVKTYAPSSTGVSAEISVEVGKVSEKTQPKIDLVLVNKTGSVATLRMAQDNSKNFNISLYDLVDGSSISDIPTVLIADGAKAIFKTSMFELPAGKKIHFELPVKIPAGQSLKVDVMYRVYVNFTHEFSIKIGTGDWKLYDGQQVSFESILVKN